MPKGSEGLSLSEEARAFGRDEHEAQLLEQFFSWPPPPPRAADLRLEPFERAPLPRGTRRAIWASSLIFILSISLIGGYFGYHNYVMPAPAPLGDWSDSDVVALPTPILADDVAQAEPEPRRVYQASLQHDISAIQKVEPVADAPPAGEGTAPPAELKPAPALGTHAETSPAAPAVVPANAAPISAAAQGQARALADPAEHAPTANQASSLPADNAADSAPAPGEAQPPKSATPTPANADEPVPAAAAPNFYEQLSLAQQQLAQGELRRSLPTFERALELRAHSVDALLGKATALFGLKEYEAAKSSAQLAVAIDPRSNEAFALIGGSLEWLGRRAEAQAIYERCIEESIDASVCRERLAHLSERK